jgi:hypothetical protein
VTSIDVTIDALMHQADMSRQEAEDFVRQAARRTIKPEPRQWDSADISYEEPA